VLEGVQVRALVRYNLRRAIGQPRLLDVDVSSKLEIIGGDLRDSEVVHAAVNG
jgi:hypothetical protein